MNIIITGGSKGIGYECAKNFAGDISNSVFVIARNKKGLEALQQEVSVMHNGRINVIPYAFDLVQGDYKDDLLPAILRHFRTCDILVNNAGALVKRPFEEMTDEDFDLMFDTNVKAIFKLTRALLPIFSRGGHILNISSMGGFQGSAKFAGLSLYSASKGAVAVLTEALALELKSRDIRVNALALGAAQTEMLGAAFPGYKAPLTAKDMAAFVSDFALHGHQWFNGKILPVALSTP